MIRVVAFRLVDRSTAIYGLEQQTVSDLLSASVLAVSWWSDSATVAIVIREGGREDSRYTRPGLADGRIPSGWPRPVSARMVVDDEDRTDIDLVIPVAASSNAPQQLPTHACLVCGIARPASGSRHEGDTDPTPSGRLHNQRCPECGAFVRHVPLHQIYRAYLLQFRGPVERG